MQSQYTNVYDKLWELLFYHVAGKCGVYGYKPIIKRKDLEEAPQVEPEG